MLRLLVVSCLCFSVILASSPDRIPIDEGYNNDRAIPSDIPLYITTHSGYPTETYRDNINSSLTLTGVPPDSLLRLDMVIRPAIELEDCFDYLDIIGVREFQNHTKKICADVSDQSVLYLHLVNDSITFRFVSDGSVTYQGALIKLHTVLPIEIGGIYDRRALAIAPLYISTHKNYPQKYSNNLNSALTLTGISRDSLIRLRFAARSGIALEKSCHDYLNITGVHGYDRNTVQICGTEASQPMLYLQPIEESLTFTFVTDYSEGYAGFVIEFSEVEGISSDGYNSAAELEVIPIEQGRNAHSAAPSRRLIHIVTHKGYPILPYGSNINCSLTLTGLSAYPLYRIDLTARSGIELDSNCSDFLDVPGIASHGRLKICGGDLEDLTYYVTPSTDTMSFWFITSQEQTYQGVLLVYSAVLPIYLEKNFNRRVSSQGVSYIATHKLYPDYYDDNINSALTITDIPPKSQIRLDFTAQAKIALEYLCLDYVNITGVSGYAHNTVQICGSEALQSTLYLNPIDESLSFIFFTDYQEIYHGFVMEYSVISQPDTTELVSTEVVTSESSPLISIDPTASATSIEGTSVALIAVVCALVIIIIVLVVILVKNRRKSALSVSKDMSVALPEVNSPPKIEQRNIDRDRENLELSPNKYSQRGVQRPDKETKQRANKFVRRPVHSIDQEYTNASYVERVNNQDDSEIYEDISD